MTNNTRKISVILTALVSVICLFLALIGFIGTPNKADAALASNHTARIAEADAVDKTNVKSYMLMSTSGINLQQLSTKEAPSATAKKVFLEYTTAYVDHNTTGGGSYDVGVYNAQGTLTGCASIGTWYINRIIDANYRTLITLDIETGALSLDKVTGQFRSGTLTCDLSTNCYLGYQFNVSTPTIVTLYNNVQAYDDTGKDLGWQSFNNSIFEAKYVVTYDSNGGSNVGKVGAANGGTVDEPTAPIKDGFAFGGWYSDSNLNTKYDFSSAVNSDITLYAKWIEQFDIKFNTNGGSTIADTVNQTEYITEPDAPVKDGYVFAGWYTDETLQNRYDFSTVVTQNLTLYAKWATVSEQLLYANGVDELSIQSNIKPDDNATTVTVEYTPIAVSGGTSASLYVRLDSSITNGINASIGTGFIDRFSKVGYTYKFIINLKNNALDIISYRDGVSDKGNYPVINADLTTVTNFGMWFNGNTTRTLLWKAKVYDNTGKDLGIKSSNGWVFADHTVTFNSNGGYPVNPIGVANNGTITAPIAVKEGKIFAGWYADGALTNKYDFTAPITSNVTLYAKYYDQTPLYTAKVNNAGDANTTVLSRLAPSANATKVYFEYTLSDEQIKGVCGWLGARMYQTLGAGASYKELAGIQFGVYNDPCLAANTTYIITFDLVDNTMTWVDKAVPSVVLKEGTLAEGAMKDFAYFGFYANIKQDTLFTSDSTVSVRAYDDLGKDLKITTTYANSTEIELPEVTFVTNGGSSVDKQTVYGANATAPTDCVKENYEIESWCSDEQLQNVYDFNTEVTADFTLYAKWTEATLYITYDSMNGSAVEMTSAKYNTPAPAPQENPTKTNYTFVGWYVDENCTTAYDFNTPMSKNITLYAKWAPVKYTITFVTNGGSAIEPLLAKYGVGAIKPNDPTKDGYELEGWYLDEALTRKYNFGTTVYGDLTLYAKWVEVDETPTTTPDTTPETESDGGCGAAVNSTFALGSMLILASAIMIVRKVNKKEN